MCKGNTQVCSHWNSQLNVLEILTIPGHSVILVSITKRSFFSLGFMNSLASAYMRFQQNWKTFCKVKNLAKSLKSRIKLRPTPGVAAHMKCEVSGSSPPLPATPRESHAGVTCSSPRSRLWPIKLVPLLPVVISNVFFFFLIWMLFVKSQEVLLEVYSEML